MSTLDDWYEGSEIDRKEMSKAVYEALAPVCRKYGYGKAGGKKIFLSEDCWVILYDDMDILQFSGHPHYDNLHKNGALD